MTGSSAGISDRITEETPEEIMGAIQEGNLEQIPERIFQETPAVISALIPKRTSIEFSEYILSETIERIPGEIREVIPAGIPE